MGLDNEPIPSAFQRFAYSRPKVRVGGIEIEIIDSETFRRIEQLRGHGTVIFFHAFTAHANHTDLKTCVSEFTIFHIYLSNVLATCFNSSRIGRCCGQTLSHFPHPIHSDAFA